jgi:hypothetical protein
MLRDRILALIAVAGVTLGSAAGALAFGGGGHGGHGGFHGGRFGGRGYAGGYGGYYGGYGHLYPYASSGYYSEGDVSGCYLRVMTPYGWRIRRGRVCN